MLRRNLKQLRFMSVMWRAIILAFYLESSQLKLLFWAVFACQVYSHKNEIISLHKLHSPSSLWEALGACQLQVLWETAHTGSETWCSVMDKKELHPSPTFCYSFSQSERTTILELQPGPTFATVMGYSDCRGN